MQQFHLCRNCIYNQWFHGFRKHFYRNKYNWDFDNTGDNYFEQIRSERRRMNLHWLKRNACSAGVATTANIWTGNFQSRRFERKCLSPFCSQADLQFLKNCLQEKIWRSKNVCFFLLFSLSSFAGFTFLPEGVIKLFLGPLPKN